MMHYPINPGCIRVQATLGEMGGTCDYKVAALPEWIESLETSVSPRMVRGSENGAQMAGAMAFASARRNEWDLACMASLWIVLYGPTVHDTTLHDYIHAVDNAVVMITADAEGSLWHMQAGVLEPVIEG